MAYRGKYPKRIKGVSYVSRRVTMYANDGSVLALTTEEFMAAAKELVSERGTMELPHPGDDMTRWFDVCFPAGM